MSEYNVQLSDDDVMNIMDALSSKINTLHHYITSNTQLKYPTDRYQASLNELAATYEKVSLLKQKIDTEKE